MEQLTVATIFVIVTLMRFSAGQLEKLAELFIDIAKGAILGSLVAPAIGQISSVISVLRGLLIGVAFMYLSLKAVELKETKL
ncbi:hypothetical protein HY086_01245 [Candidatus Gottesmanbacteria bacterium]|nr:hypothetical protein [Candidatus Gottesmanbacteria bacterium]